ncbi:hypothetical protein FACS1894111_11310 [Clostridia bacterium]|nr:hypothetical protein FACS1894111_11310 [Clostridia bacterium]
MKKIPYGESNFESIIREDYLYIDKTKYLGDLEYNKKLIYLRPRRFGKTLFTSMLDYYYGLDHADKFDDLFRALYVYDNPTPYKNSYYILKFNFSGVAAGNKADSEELSKLFANKVVQGLEKFCGRYKFNFSLDKKAMAAAVLGDFFVQFAGLELQNKIYVIIDEYDHFTNGLLRGNAKEFLEVLQRGGFVRAFYEVIKEYSENGIVDRFFATGVMPVSLDSMTSGFNISTNITRMDAFAAMIAFTEQEVREAIKVALPSFSEVDREQIYQELKQNYDGYRFTIKQEEHVFNGTLVMYYLSRYQRGGEAPEELIDSNLNVSGESIRNIVELLEPESNVKVIEELSLNNEVSGSFVPYFQLDKSYAKNDMLTLLFSVGFLTIKEKKLRLLFRIPNRVMEGVYFEYLLQAAQRRSNYRIDTTEIEDAILSFAEKGDLTGIADLVKNFLVQTGSRDTINFSEKNLKHTFSMFLSLSRQYVVHGEFPAGKGFADLLIQKSQGSYATYEGLLELKYVKEADATEGNIQKLTEEGKEQIKRYLQDKRLQERENLKKYVVIFVGFERYYLEEIA